MASSLFTKKQRKPRSVTSPSETLPQQFSKKNRLSKRKKKNLLANYEVDKEEPSIPDYDSAIKLSGIIRQPPRGEKRFVYLDPSQGRYGFRLQSYGRTREQGKVLQTFVQSVNPGSPSFMAGLYPGDAIVEVNGVDVKYAPVENVVEEIQKGAKTGGRVALTVEFVDGVTRLECMRKSDEFKNDIKTRQKRLKELLDNEGSLPTNDAALTSPVHITAASDLSPWADVPPTFEPMEPKFPHNYHLNTMIAAHSGAINSLSCDVLVMPISSCHKGVEEKDKNVLLQLLRTGGPALLDDLSLAKQCKIGENISTWGHNLPAKYIYHSVFGDLEESLQSCCHNAMAEASKNDLRTIVFWLDGFASLSVSPHIVIEAVRNWLQQDTKRNMFDKVVFSSKANTTLVEKFMHTSFPLYPSASGHDGDSLNSTQQDQVETKPLEDEKTMENKESAQADNDVLDVRDVDFSVSDDEEVETKGDDNAKGDDDSKGDEDAKGDDDVSTDDISASLQKIQDENMRTFEELVDSFAEKSTPRPKPSISRLSATSPQPELSKSLPSNHASDFLRRREFFEARSVSPLSRSRHSRSQSGDHILNPDRTESDV